MIRRAGIGDLPEVMRLLVRFHKENGLCPLNPEKVSNRVGRLLRNGDLIVAEMGEGLAGILGLAESEYWYGDERYLVDQFFYVEPEFRAENVGTELMAEARAEGLRRGIPVFVAVYNPARAKKRGRIAAVAGFFPMGYFTRLAA
jgi:GNAT superfamily N-acetyltransferase